MALQCKALKTFNSTQYGFIRTGARFTSEHGYAMQLRANGLIEILNEPNQPQRVQAFGSAPVTQGKEQAPSNPPPARPDSAGQADDGAAKPSLLSRAGRASQRPTAHTSKGNARQS
jgi:hypothetical protein